jgi:acetyl esterase/lipase
MPSEEFLKRKGSVWEQYDFNGKDMPTVRREMENFVVGTLRTYDDVRWTEGVCGNYRGKWVLPANPTDGVIFYIHGGGFTLGSSGIPLPFLLELSHRLKIACFSLDYRLAPEHPFPAAPHDAFAAYQELMRMGYDPERIVLCGESAGATLCLSLLHQNKAEGVAMPAAAVAISPVTDASPDRGRNADKVLDNLPAAEEVWEMYAPNADLTDPRISPALGDLSGFPPTLLSAGGNEPLVKDALLYAENAAAAGSDVSLHIGKDMIHTYPLDLWDYPEAMEAFDEIEFFIRKRLR